jgi:stage III sporulation protein AA
VISNEGFERAAMLLPIKLREAAMALSKAKQCDAEEIRLRAGRGATVLVGNGEESILQGYTVTSCDLRTVLEIATAASAHSEADSLRQGFVTVKGGCRVGFCGKAVMTGGNITGLKNLSSAAIRIPRQVIGCASEIFHDLYGHEFQSTLIVSPPGAGKTTLLREIVRLLSARGERVSLVDERSEVAAVWDEEAQFDVGPFTDILTATPKAEGLMLVLRSMNPQIVAVDEITDSADARAIENAANCGVKILATAHGTNTRDLLERPVYKVLLDRGIFKRAVLIKKEKSRRSFFVEEL